MFSFANAITSSEGIPKGHLIIVPSAGSHSATTLQPEAAYDLIRDKASRAVKNIKKYKPYKVKNPVTVEMGFKNYRPVEILSYLSLFERIGSHTIRFSAKNMEEAARIITFVLMYGGGNSTP